MRIGLRLMRRADAETAVYALIQIIHLQMAYLGRQAAVDDEKQVAYLVALIVVLRFIQNQLPGRPGSAAAFQG